MKANLNFEYLVLARMIGPKTEVREGRDQAFLLRLRDDVQENGIQVPISVLPPDANGMYEVLDGEHRRQVAIMLGLEKVPCTIVADKMDQAEILCRRFNANELRSPHTPFERASAYVSWMKLTGKCAADAARQFRVSEALISQCVTIRNRIADDQRHLIESGKITFRSAYTVGSGCDDPVKRHELIALLAEDKLTLEGAKAEIQRLKPKKGNPKDVLLDLGKGVVVHIPEASLDHLIEMLAKLPKAAKEAKTKGLPACTIPKLMDAS